jgi:uncharacterized protein YcgI (DUF1989 family)
MTVEPTIIPARSGAAVRLKKGESVKLINTLGSQVVDTWAFNSDDIDEYMSMEHTRVMLGKLNPTRGDGLFSNRRRALLTLTEDTTEGVHDTLRAACDPIRYKILGLNDHESCQNNLFTSLKELGIEIERCPCPLNVFEVCNVNADGTILVTPPKAQAGEYVVFRAELDAIVVFSACPMDVFPTNGPDCTPKPVAYVVQH